MAKLQDGKKQPRSKKNRKYGRNKNKCESYRARVGKPLGPGKPGCKAGKKRAPGSKNPAKRNSSVKGAISIF